MAIQDRLIHVQVGTILRSEQSALFRGRNNPDSVARDRVLASTVSKTGASTARGLDHYFSVTDWSNRPVRPDHVVHAAELAAAALAPHDGADWSVRAGDLEWDVEKTVVHIIGALANPGLSVSDRV